MYGQNRLDDWKRMLRAIATNQLARIAPKLYLRLTHQTGRGADSETPDEVATYFRTCFSDYFRILGIPELEIGRFLSGKRVLEYGPGDCPGVALLMVAHGAARAVCVDRFPMVSLSPKTVSILSRLVNSLEGEARVRAESCFRSAGNPASGLDEEKLRYLVRPSGLSGLRDEIDLAISRAALEHVDDLDATFADMRQALSAKAVCVHEVDLKSHGLHKKNPLDFLTWPESLWRVMYSHKGVPNRARVDRFSAVLEKTGFIVTHLSPTSLADEPIVREVKPHLAGPFRQISDEHLRWLGFWLVCRPA